MAIDVTFETVEYRADGIIAVPLTLDKSAVVPTKTAFAIERVSGSNLEDIEWYVSGSGIKYALIFEMPPGRFGTFRISPEGYVFNASSGGWENLTGDAVTVAYDTLVKLPDDPDVSIEVSPGLIRTRQMLVTFKWTKAIADFVSSAVAVSHGTLSDLSGEGDTHTAVITLPEAEEGQGTITLAANTGTDIDGRFGPQNDRVASFGFDTRPETVTMPPNACEETYDFDDTSNPFVPGAGAFEAPLETKAVRRGSEDYLYVVWQLSEWTDEYDKPPNKPILIGKHLDLDSQARAVLVKIALSSCTWTVIKSYRFVSTAARSLHEKDGKVYWFEGSHYCYYNEGYFKRIEPPEDGRWYVHWIGDPRDVIRNQPRQSGRWTRKETANSDGEYSVSDGEITFVSSRTSASYTEVREAFRTNAKLFIGTTSIQILNIRLTDVNIEVAQYVADFKIIEGELPEVDERSVINILKGRSIDAYSNYRLRPLYVAYQASGEDWKSGIGHLYSVDESDTITDHGLNWVSSDLNAAPDREAVRPLYESEQIDRYYGAHGGTASPIVEDGDGNLHLITGYADLDNVLNSDSEAARLGNWQWLRYGTDLELTTPVLETNNRTAWDVLRDTAILSDTYVAFDKEQFQKKPKTPVKAELAQSVPAENYPSSSLHLKNLSRETVPASGTVIIDNEVFTYTGFDGNRLSPFERAAEGSVAGEHPEGSDVYWVDHILEWDRYAVDPMDRFQVENDTTRLYNQVAIRYGTDKVYEVEDADSIAAYGVRRFEASVALGDTQTVVAKDRAERYLAAFKLPRQRVVLRLKLSLYLEMIDVLLVRESDRTGLDTVMRVVDVDHAIFRNETRATCVLLEGIG